MRRVERLAKEHREVTRRYFLQLGAAGVAALSVSRLWAQDGEADSPLTEAISKLEYLTREENSINSHMTTCARFVHTWKKMKAGRPAPVTRVAQVGMSGLSKVQCWLCPHDAPPPKDDPYFTKAEWKDADVLPPDHWRGGLPDGRLPPVPRQIDTATGNPYRWPIRNTLAHWAALLPALRPAQYDLRCRTIDANGIAQPMPRPFPKSGHNTIQRVQIIVGT